jgi:hypothetical protein
MTDPEKTQLLIGKLVLEDGAIEKKIGVLRNELSRRAGTFAQIGRLLVLQPERLLFEGQTIEDEQFAGEAAIDRAGMDVDCLIAELRAAIIRKKACTVQLLEMGIDLEEAEREHNLRLSRALHNPANVRPAPEDGGTKRAVGFARPRQKSES